MRSRLLVLLLAVGWVSCASPHRTGPFPAAPIKEAQIAHFEHVFIVVEENESYDDVIGNVTDMPYLNMLADKYGLATNYYANTHPSINNYFFLTAGRRGTRSPWIRNLSDEYPGDVAGNNVASVLTANGKTWKAYMESIPRVGYVGDDRFPYVKRHNPFAYFESVRESKAAPGQHSERDNIVPFDNFARDLQNDSLPNYSFIVPNLYNDGHHDPVTHRMAFCGDPLALQNIDKWLANNMGSLVGSATFQHGSLLIIIFDEACERGPKADWRYDPKMPHVSGGGRVPAILVSSQIAPGTRSAVLYHHESVLRLSLQALSVEQLPGLAGNAPDMNEFFTAKH
jgi:acid phosphatase